MSGQTNGGVFNPKNLNMFGYTVNNPITLVDPDGESFVLAALVIVAAVGYFTTDEGSTPRRIVNGLIDSGTKFNQPSNTGNLQTDMVTDAMKEATLNKVGNGFSTGGGKYLAKSLPQFKHNKLSPQMQSNYTKTFHRLIDGGKRPSNKSMRSNWGKTFKNNQGHLPSLGTGGYKEFKIAGPTNAKNDNVFRMVVGKNGKAYYSNTHYGTNPNVKGKAFYEAGQFSKKQTRQIFRNNGGK